MLQAALQDMKYQTPVPELRLQWVPEDAELAPLKGMAKAIADALPQEPLPADFGYM